MIEIHGINFDVQWDKFEPHSSFFIPCLDTKEAKRVIRNMPKWVPGEIGGRSIRARCRLPINFQLN